MGDAPSINTPVAAAPCPKCGYDLRGHPDRARCPECGSEVHVSAATLEAARWLDLRVLDLWSIGVLQTAGGTAAVLTLIAIRRGHYVALLVGLMAGLCVSTATLWFLVLIPGTAVRFRRPSTRTLSPAQLGKLRRLFVVDALLVVAAPLLLMVVTGL